ncbi:Elongation factor G [Frankliniella fusca]|uniref:Elongation factor G n=1 Tax=Frankliniella fusca TaxID=407009 RepID=A0AAE1H6W2_9NEOP|nr:Elongation factor G [Frankliniella fusca]
MIVRLTLLFMLYLVRDLALSGTMWMTDTLPPTKICVPRDVSSRVSLLSMRPSMVRVQAEHRPNIPHTFEELDEAFRNHQDLGRRVFVGEIRYLFGDATYYCRPNHPDSMQSYTLVTVRDNHIVPLLYALIESRTQTAYQDLFSAVRRIIPELDPDFVITDFEAAQQNAVVGIFPRARLTDCLFHFARAVCRNVRLLGLHALVRDNENARRVVRLCLAIPLAPPNRLIEALNAVVVEARRLNLHNQMSDLFNYLRATLIEGVGEHILSVFGVRHRTNNVAEAHHRNLNARVVRRPDIWRFIDLVREMEDIAWRDIGRLESGLAPSGARRVSSLLSDAREVGQNLSRHDFEEIPSYVASNQNRNINACDVFQDLMEESTNDEVEVQCEEFSDGEELDPSEQPEINR